MRLPVRMRDPADIALVALFAATEISAVLDPPKGSKAALIAFPAGWILPLLVRRRFPTGAPLVALAALTIEGQIAYAGTETQWVLPPVIFAFYTLGRRVETSRAILAWLLGGALGVILLSAGSGSITAADLGFLAIVSVAPFAAGMAIRVRAAQADEMARHAEE